MREADRIRYTQFNTLRRMFWSRVVDLEALSVDGDLQKLTGQILTILAGISVAFSAPLVVMGGPLPESLAWTPEHFFLSTSMAVTGVLTILSWNSMLPDRKDLLVLGSLPVRLATMFAAKTAALLGLLSCSVIALNCLSGLLWPLLFSAAGAGMLGSVRAMIAWWITLALSAGFIFYCGLSCVAAGALLLPRQLFLRVSAILQVAAFIAVLSTWVLEPSFESIAALTDPRNQRLLAMLPSYWFLGMFQQLNGSMQPAFLPLAHRAWMGVGVAVVSGSLSVLLAWYLRMRRIIEQPDILPIRNRPTGLPVFRNSLRAAIVLFSLRSLIRSQPHRILYAFYLSLGLVIAGFYLVSPQVRAGLVQNPRTLPLQVLTASLMLLCFSVLAAQLVIGFPVSLRANWIFQMTQIHTPDEYRKSARAALAAMSVIPANVFMAIMLMALCPGWIAVVHILSLAMVGFILIEVLLLTLRKLPFACSYLPGKAQMHVLFWAGVLICVPIAEAAGRVEFRMLAKTEGRIEILICLLLCAVVIRFATRLRTGVNSLVFEEAEPDVVTSLNLSA